MGVKSETSTPLKRLRLVNVSRFLLAAACSALCRVGTAAPKALLRRCSHARVPRTCCLSFGVHAGAWAGLYLRFGSLVLVRRPAAKNSRTSRSV